MLRFGTRGGLATCCSTKSWWLSSCIKRRSSRVNPWTWICCCVTGVHAGVKFSTWMVLLKRVCVDSHTSGGNHLFELSYAIIRLELELK